MFFRTKSSGPPTYLQVVENRWEGGRSRQRLIATLGRLDQLQQNGQLDSLLVSGARLARSVLVLSEHAQGKLLTISVRHIGPALVFQRLWQLIGCEHVIQQLLKGRRFEFAIERAIFLTVLHRLFDPGSGRAADNPRRADTHFLTDLDQILRTESQPGRFGQSTRERSARASRRAWVPLRP